MELRTTCWRHIRLGRDPLSGTGARIQGGRWNPPNSFAVVYLATDQATVGAEFRRLVERQGLDPTSFLPRAMYSYELFTATLLDLTAPATLDAIGLREGDLRANDLAGCQAVGEAAYACRRSGVMAPSATGQGVVVALFPDCLASGEVFAAGDYELWETPESVPAA